MDLNEWIRLANTNTVFIIHDLGNKNGGRIHRLRNWIEINAILICIHNLGNKNGCRPTEIHGYYATELRLMLCNVCNMYHESRIIPAGYIRSSGFDVADVAI